MDEVAFLQVLDWAISFAVSDEAATVEGVTAGMGFAMVMRVRNFTRSGVHPCRTKSGRRRNFP